MTGPRGWWARLRETLWFLPAVIVVFAVLLGVGMVELSAAVEAERLSPWSRVFGAGPDGARSMLSAIAGSMITVAGVTFSITMVAVTQASAQYTPRILRNFMRDRANQAVLGTFVGVFAYCLVVLRTVRENDGGDFVPSLAVLVAMLLALLGIAVLIFFIHHIATTLQASEIISRITRETCEIVDRLYPEELDPGKEEIEDDGPVPRTWRPVLSRDTGYLQDAGIGGLVRTADQFDLLIRLERATGDFVSAGRPIARFAPHPLAEGGAEWKPSDVTDAVRGRLVIDVNRTLDQDPAFGIRQLVDIALKAISPGVNDTTTAVTCIDYLGAILGWLARRRMPRHHHGTHGRLRVITAEPGFGDLLGLAVDEIRQHARGNVSVLARQFGMLECVAHSTGDPGRRRALARQVELVRGAAVAAVGSGEDLERLEGLAREALIAAQGTGPAG